MAKSPRRDVRETKARPSVWDPVGWAAMLTTMLTGAIFFTNDLHSLPSHIGDFCAGILLLPAGFVFVLLESGQGDFLSWLSGFPDWFLFMLQALGAYFYSLVITLLIWTIMRLVSRGRSVKLVLSSH